MATAAQQGYRGRLATCKNLIYNYRLSNLCQARLIYLMTFLTRGRDAIGDATLTAIDNVLIDIRKTCVPSLANIRNPVEREIHKGVPAVAATLPGGILTGPISPGDTNPGGPGGLGKGV
jgi:hypothetical protein